MQVNIRKISQNHQNQPKMGKKWYQFSLLGGTLELRLLYTIFLVYKNKFQKYFLRFLKCLFIGDLEIG